MARKIGQDIAEDFWDRGRREIGGLWPDSNIAQPTYPSRGGYASSKEVETPTTEQPAESVLDERLATAERGREDPGRDDPGIERE